MDSPRPSFYLCPSWDLSPDEVRLGSVIANIRNPQNALSSSDLQGNPDFSIRTQGPKPASGTVKMAREWSAGLFASFVQLASVGAEVSYTSSSAQEVEYSCEAFETRRFTPSLTYIKEVAEDESVKPYLKYGGLRYQVFIITGVKIASGLTLTTMMQEGYEAKGQIGLDTPALRIGPQASHKTGVSNTHTTQIEGPIVFAFQVEKLVVSMRGKLSSKEHVRGAMLGKTGHQDYVLETAGGRLDESDVANLCMRSQIVVDEATNEHCELFLSSR